ncbi:diguanylate cyclase [Psychrobacillus sp. L3]|uniref:diguanylate cyclase n=1 Tax=Psychrobacillus sp. L3 TaxID=3236891 RepID=UPI0036F35629
MLLDFIVNFCILFTFAILTYIPFQNKVNLFIPSTKYHPFLLGIFTGLTGCLLILKSVSISEHVIVDGRMAVIVLSGVLGGPFATIISAIIIGLFRILLYGYSTNTLITGGNTLIVGLVIGISIWKKPMSFHNAPYYFTYTIIQTSIVIFYLHHWSFSSIITILGFILYSIVSFSIVFVVLKQLSNLFNKIHQIEEMSETDYLTGLYNNRKFQEYAQNLLKTNDSFSLILLDIDHFKIVNDTYGHPIGDEVLKELAFRIKDSTNSQGGIVSRNGGEEFSVLLSNIAADKSIEIAETIRQAIERRPFQVSTGEQLTITISVGVSSYPENGHAIMELYKLADEALYIAKSSGRNKVMHIKQT